MALRGSDRFPAACSRARRTLDEATGDSGKAGRMLRRTKIVATLGPASRSDDVIARMIRAGMDVVRLNTSHDDLASHVEALEQVRRVAAAEGKHVGVLMDLGGPKLRTAPSANGDAVALMAGAAVMVTAEPGATSAEVVRVPYPHLVTDVHSGDQVLLDDGNLELVVEGARGNALACRVVTGGVLASRKGVSFPRSRLQLSALTPRDIEAIAAGVDAGADYFGLSFVGSAADVERARAAIHARGADVPIIAKIERGQAVQELDAILAVSDGAMVARGDLGVELPLEDVPIQQRRIIASAGRHMIPVITATQMLESMIDSPRPTRAESSDVANAVWDLSDALMLSAETAVGKYPVEAVAVMDRIIRRAEGAAAPDIDEITHPATDDHSHVVALAVRRIVESDANIRGIVSFTRSGYTALLLSKVHPAVPVYGFSPNESVCRRLSLARGVTPVLAPLVTTSDDMLRMVDGMLMEGGHVALGEEVVVVASMPVHADGTTNFLKLHRVGESRSY